MILSRSRCPGHHEQDPRAFQGRLVHRDHRRFGRPACPLRPEHGHDEWLAQFARRRRRIPFRQKIGLGLGHRHRATRARRAWWPPRKTPPSSRRENPEFMPPIGPQKYPAGTAFCSGNAGTTSAMLAAAIQPVLQQAQAKNLQASGFLDIGTVVFQLRQQQGPFRLRPGQRRAPHRHGAHARRHRRGLGRHDAQRFQQARCRGHGRRRRSTRPSARESPSGCLPANTPSFSNRPPCPTSSASWSRISTNAPPTKAAISPRKKAADRGWAKMSSAKTSTFTPIRTIRSCRAASIPTTACPRSAPSGSKVAS